MKITQRTIEMKRKPSVLVGKLEVKQQIKLDS